VKKEEMVAKKARKFRETARKKTHLVGDLVLVRSEATTRPDTVLLLKLRKELLELTVTLKGRSRVTVVLWEEESQHSM
jgi:hypothetical protein